MADENLIQQLYQAKNHNVQVNLIVRGICCALTETKKWEKPIKAISIVDEYLEHARVIHFENGKQNEYYLSSADWMVRNLDHRIETTVPIYDTNIKEELKNILQIQLSDNTKARVLDNQQQNNYELHKKGEAAIRSQIEIYRYLKSRKYL